MLHKGRGPGRSIAAKGMAWTGITVVLAKLMSIVSQIVLGHLLSVETYAVFAAATAALAFVSGFQNSGVGKVLVQRQSEYERIAADFAGFAFYLGSAGAVVLFLIALGLSAGYGMPDLLPILAVSAITIPIISINSIYTAKQSIALSFKTISIYSTTYTAIYYIALLLSAYFGTESFSIALATLFAAVAMHFVYIRRMGVLDINFRFSPASFWSVFSALKWTMLSSYIFGFTQSGDYLVLGRLFDKDQLGYYYFGFMLTANVGLLLSLAISQTLMPIFSKIKDDTVRLKRAFAQASETIIFLSSIICLGIVAVAPEAVHSLWSGKWDPSIFVAVAMAVTFPLRVLASMAAVALEARGRWRQRTMLLVYDALGIMIFAAVGAWLGALSGAAVAVAFHRGVTGLLAFPVAMRSLEFHYGDIGRYFLQSATPFFLIVALVIAFKQWLGPVPGAVEQLLIAAGVAGAAIAVFLAVTFLTNRKVLGYFVPAINRRT